MHGHNRAPMGRAGRRGARNKPKTRSFPRCRPSSPTPPTPAPGGAAWSRGARPAREKPARPSRTSSRKVRSHVEIIVSDSGEGIRADILPYIFDRLRPRDPSSPRTQEGLGVGLALVRHLVELHGGSVIADSPGEGQGATFVVKLPLMVAEVRERAVAHTDTPAVTASSLAGVRILVVDDDPTAVDLVREVLVQAGGEVRGSGTGGEGVRGFEQWRPGILGSECGMPGADGYT